MGIIPLAWRFSYYFLVHFGRCRVAIDWFLHGVIHCWHDGNSD